MTAIIVDDEKHCREVLEHLLKKHCQDIEVVASCKDGTDAIKSLERERPDLLFLDIEMPGMNGFEVLEKSAYHPCAIIFTTAYNEYAIMAIKHSALDYLLKPIDKDELVLAVQRAREHQSNYSQDRIADLLTMINKQKSVRRFAAATLEGLIMVNAHDILYCESDSAYCKLIFFDGHSLLLSKTLKEVEEALQHEAFCRIHHSYLINLDYVEKYIKGEGGEVVLHNGKYLPVSRSRKQDFLRKLEKI